MAQGTREEVPEAEHDPFPGQEFDIHAANDASNPYYAQWVMQADPDSRKQPTYFSFKT